MPTAYAKLAKTLRTPYGIRVSRAVAGSSTLLCGCCARTNRAQIELWPIAKVSSVLSPKYANCNVLRACEKWQLFRERAQPNVPDNELCTEREVGAGGGGRRAANERGQLVIMLLRDITTSGNSLSRHRHTHIPMYGDLEPREYRRPQSRHSDGRTQRGCS